MRRLIAFLVDFLIAFIFSLFLIYILELITNRSLSNKYVIAVSCILFISVFEFTHWGITPGRLLIGLSLVDINNKSLTINRIFRRNCLLVFFPFLANFVSDFFFDWVFQTTPLFVMDEVGSGWIIFCILFLSIFALTLGNQSFHDYVFDTVVVSNKKKSKLRVASRGQVWLIIITILVLTVAWQFTLKTQNLKAVAALKDTEFNKRYEAQIQDPVFLNLIVTQSDFDSKISDIDKYYRGGSIFLDPLQKYSKSAALKDLSDYPIVNSLLEKLDYIPEYFALLTISGMTNFSIQENISRIACKKANAKLNFPICKISFAYTVNILGPIYVTIRRPIYIIRFLGSKLGEDLYFNLSPASSLEYNWSIGTPGELLMYRYVNRNPAAPK